MRHASSPFCCDYFGDRLSLLKFPCRWADKLVPLHASFFPFRWNITNLFCLRWLGTRVLPILAFLAFYVAWDDTCHHIQLLVEMGVSWTFLWVILSQSLMAMLLLKISVWWIPWIWEVCFISSPSFLRC
jgi:hypothetical protein